MFGRSAGEGWTSSVVRARLKSLDEKVKVEYEVEEGAKRPQARDLRVVLPFDLRGPAARLGVLRMARVRAY